MGLSHPGPTLLVVEQTAGQPRQVVLLGSTGSIGTQALDVVGRAPGAFAVVGLAAGSAASAEQLAAQAREVGARVVALADPAGGPALREALTGTQTRVLLGPDAAEELAGEPCHTVLNGIAGVGGLKATLAALAAGRVVALANKESLIAGGPLVLDALGGDRGRLVPVDSEHSALWQCLLGFGPGDVRRLVLTASGGPFRGRRRDELTAVTPEQALAHPTWAMGPLVTVNSATLVNKGLEVIEAALLFGHLLPGGATGGGDPYDAIDVVVHPQSVVHSMVEGVDGATLAQLSPPDMRLPISLGMGWPTRVPDAAPGMDWSRAQALTFEPLDEAAFPAVALAREAGRTGGTAPAVYAAAAEAAVGEFLAGRLAFLEIVDVVAEVLHGHRTAPTTTLQGVLNAEQEARAAVRDTVAA